MITTKDIATLLSTVEKVLKKKNFGKATIIVEVDSYSFDKIDKEMYDMNLSDDKKYVPSEGIINIKSDICGAILLKKEKN